MCAVPQGLSAGSLRAGPGAGRRVHRGRSEWPGRRVAGRSGTGRARAEGGRGAHSNMWLPVNEAPASRSVGSLVASLVR